jgi:hypothetical protein
MENLAVLLNQHKSIRSLLQVVQKHLSSHDRNETLHRIRSEIENHTSLEEAHVYPILENFEPLKREVFGFWREHERLRTELESVLAVYQDEEQFQKNLIRLNQTFEEHIKEEETQIFPEACKIVPKEQLEKIDRNLEAATQRTRKIA